MTKNTKKATKVVEESLEAIVNTYWYSIGLILMGFYNLTLNNWFSYIVGIIVIIAGTYGFHRRTQKTIKENE